MTPPSPLARLWIRADGSPSLGYGHVMRTIAVGEAARRQGLDVRYAIDDDPVSTDLVARRGFPVISVAPGPDWLESVRDHDAVLFDGYHFDGPHLEAAGRVAGAVGAVDDFGRGDYPVDVLLNQNPPEGTAYQTRPDTLLLLGPLHALIREEFRRPRRPGDVLLLTFGAADATGLGARVVAALDEQLPFRRVVLLSGPAATDVPARPWLDVVRDPSDVGAVFATARAALSAGGSTTWELLSMGIPTALVAIVDNQEPVVGAAVGAGAALDLGRADGLEAAVRSAVGELADAAVRRRLTRAARGVVDGGGADRLVAGLVAAAISRAAR